MSLPVPSEQTHLAHPKYRADIDGLRAIAVLAVVGFHAFPYWVQGGFIGVDIFFVISGFLISSIIFENLHRDSFSFIEFYSRRIKRIFPALIVVLTASFVIGWFVLFVDEYKQLGKHIAGGAGFIENFLLWRESGYFDNAAETKPLLHLWTLAIEEQFYIVWPLALRFAWKKRLNLLTIAIVVAITSFALNIGKVHSDAVAAFYSPQTRFWELMAGSILAYIKLYKQNIFDAWLSAVIYDKASDSNPATLHNIQSLFGAVLICAGILVIKKEFSFPGWWAVLPTLGAVLVISAGPHAWINRAILSRKILVWFGLISFPLYLWHWPLLAFARIVESETPSREIRITAVLISIVLAWLTYRLIEKPIRFGKHGKAKTIALLVLMMVVGYVGYNTYQRDGLRFRNADKVALMNRFDAPYKQGCDALTGEVYKDDWCNSGTGNNKTPNVVLIGDSFSNAYSTMLNEYAKNISSEFSFIQFGRGQCPSLNDYGPAYCKLITKKAFDYIVSSKNIKTVVLATHWVDYYNGKDFTGANHKETPEAFKVAFEKTISDYKENGKNVVVLLAPPVGSNPKSCVVRPIRLTDKNICNLTLKTATENDGKYRDYLIPILQTENINYFDPFSYFCKNEECKVTSGNKILYNDDGHLSMYGGEFLANDGKVKLDEIFSNLKLK